MTYCAARDATRATSWIAPLDGVADRPELQPLRSQHLMEHVVFIPVYPELPESAFRRLLVILGGLEDDLLGEAGAVFEAGESVGREVDAGAQSEDFLGQRSSDRG